MKRLTKRLLEAMEAALSAMLAGMEGQGDWPDDLPRRDLDDAEDWVSFQLHKRKRHAAEANASAAAREPYDAARKCARDAT